MTQSEHGSFKIKEAMFYHFASILWQGGHEGLKNFTGREEVMTFYIVKARRSSSFSAVAQQQQVPVLGLTTCGSSLYSRWRHDVIFLRCVVLIVWKLLHRNTTLLSPPPSFMFSGTAERLLQKARLPLSPAAHLSGTRVIKKFLPDFFKNLIGRDVLLKFW